MSAFLHSPITVGLACIVLALVITALLWLADNDRPDRPV